MSEFKNREKRQALLFITLGFVISVFSYQNFQYPERIQKSQVDFGASLRSSDLEIQRTHQHINPQTAPTRAMATSKTQILESETPMQLRLKRAPAKTPKVKKNKKKPSLVKKKTAKKPAKKTSSKIVKKLNKKTSTSN